MKQLLSSSNVAFNVGAKTLTFTNTIPADITSILHVTNVTRGILYFQPQAGLAFSGSYTAPVLTLNCSTVGASAGDKLEIFYDDGISVAQETGNLATIVSKLSSDPATQTTLSAINVKTPALASGRVPVDGSGVTQPISGSVGLNAGSAVIGHVVVDSMPTLSISAVTANAGTNLNTSALALESGGNLAAIATKLNASVAVTGTFYQATQPVSLTSTPLPTGAATNAGITGASSKTLTDLNTTLGSPLQAGGSVSVSNFPSSQAVTLATAPTTPVSGTYLAVAPTLSDGQSNKLLLDSDGSLIVNVKDITGTVATSANQATANASLATIAGNIPILGVNVKANSQPVNIASDQVVPTSISSAITLNTVQPIVLVPPTNNFLSAIGTVQAQVEPGGTYSFCVSIHSATSAGVINNLTSCTSVVGSKTITYTGTAPQIGQLLAGAGVSQGSYVTSVNAGVGFTISIPAIAATGTITATAGYFSATMQSSPDGTNWTNITTALPKTYATNAALTGVAVAPGLFVYNAGPTDNYLRWNLTSIGMTGVASNLSANPTLRFDIDSIDRQGSVVNLPYVAYINATNPTGFPVIMPVERSGLSEISFDINTLAGTSQTISYKQSGDPTGYSAGTFASSLPITTTGAAQNAVSLTNTGAGNYRLAPASKYFLAYYSAGSVVTGIAISGCQAVVGTQPAIQDVCISTNNSPINISQISGSTPNSSTSQGSTNKNGTTVIAGVTNSTLTTTAFAGNGPTNGATQAIGDGGAVSASFDISVTTCTLGTATSVIFVIQDSYDAGTTWNDIWVCQPITTTGHIRIPAIPLHGRIRLRAWSVGGTSTTVTTATNVMEISAETLIQRQFCDVYAVTNPFNSMHNGVSVASTLVSTTLSSTSAVANVEGCKLLSISGVFTGGTPTTAPIYSLQVSQDATNWITTSCIMTPTAAGCFGATLTNTCWRFARLIVTTASAGGVAYAVTYVGINGSN